jgi:CheY-like chemotaxis protein
MLSSKSHLAALSTLGLFQSASKIVPTTTVPHHRVVLSSSISSNQSSVAVMSNRSSYGQGTHSVAATSDSPVQQPFARGAFERAISNLSTMSGYTNGSKKSGGKIRLLIADDAVISRKMVERALASVCSVCHHANNGLEALNKTKQSMAEEAPYDVVLIDYYMPIMTGAEAVLEMRTAGFKGIIMAVTGSTSKDDTNLLTRNGANVVLIKPLNLMNFRKALVVAQNQTRLQQQKEHHQQQLLAHQIMLQAPLMAVNESERSSYQNTPHSGKVRHFTPE